jgi:hypothetical protein
MILFGICLLDSYMAKFENFLLTFLEAENLIIPVKTGIHNRFKREPGFLLSQG